ALRGTFQCFALFDFQGLSRCLVGDFDKINELDAVIVEDGRPAASDMKVVASHWEPRGERRWQRAPLSRLRPCAGEKGGARTPGGGAGQRTLARAASAIRELVQKRTLRPRPIPLVKTRPECKWLSLEAFAAQPRQQFPRRLHDTMRAFDLNVGPLNAEPHQRYADHGLVQPDHGTSRQTLDGWTTNVVDPTLRP